jgi:DNA uptake protein ComE-like DNA-binding protein
MTQRGATGTDEQLTRVTRFFLENLTLVNVNSSPADELKWVLGVRDDVMQAIIARREHQPFRNLDELRAGPEWMRNCWISGRAGSRSERMM